MIFLATAEMARASACARQGPGSGASDVLRLRDDSAEAGKQVKVPARRKVPSTHGHEVQKQVPAAGALDSMGVQGK